MIKIYKFNKRIFNGKNDPNPPNYERKKYSKLLDFNDEFK
jgi:hypothetical protein